MKRTASRQMRCARCILQALGCYSLERIQRHWQSEDFGLVPALMDPSSAPPEFKVHKVEQISALEDVMAELGKARRESGA